jgi:hypothetical protein
MATTTFSPMYFEQPIILVDTAEALSVTSGCLVLYGGTRINSTYESISTSTGSIVVSGGVGIQKSLTVGGTLNLTSTADSTSVTSGALVVKGGIGVAKNIYVGQDTFINGNLYVNGVTTSINTTTINVSDNTFLLNSGPTGSKDAGVLMQRYQADSDLGAGGDIVGVSEPVALSGTVLVGGTNNIIISTTNGGLNIENCWIKIGNFVRRIVSYTNPTSTEFQIVLSTPFTSAVAVSATYSLYNRNYVAQYYDEQNDELVLGYISRANDVQISLERTDLLKVRLKTLVSTNISAVNSTIANLTTSLFTSGSINVTGSSFLQGAVTTGSLFVSGGSVLSSATISNLLVGSSEMSSLTINGVDVTPNASDISSDQLFILQNNVSTPTRITNFAFDSSTVRAFIAQITISITTSGTDKFAYYTLKGLQKDGAWVLSSTFIGDITGITFSVTSAGQVQYTSSNVDSYISSKMTFKASTSAIM